MPLQAAGCGRATIVALAALLPVAGKIEQEFGAGRRMARAAALGAAGLQAVRREW